MKEWRVPFRVAACQLPVMSHSLHHLSEKFSLLNDGLGCLLLHVRRVAVLVRGVLGLEPSEYPVGCRLTWVPA